MKNNQKRKKRNLKKIILAIVSIIAGLTSWGLYLIHYESINRILRNSSITDTIIVFISGGMILIGIIGLYYELLIVNLLDNE